MSAFWGLDPKPAILEDDPLLRAVRAAPVGSPLTDAQRAVVGESERFFAEGGHGRSQEEIDELIEQMRIEHGDAGVDT